MEPRELIRVAHRALSLTPSPLLKHQRAGKFELREGVGFTRQDMAGPGFNFAAAVGPPVALARVLELGAAFFAGPSGGYGVLVEADAGHPVEAEIKARGWAVAEEEPAFVLPTIPPTPPVPPGFSVRRADDAAGGRAYCETVGAVFGAPPEGWESLAPSPASMADPDLAYLVGYHESRAVAAAVMLACGPTAVVAGVATLPEYRRRGFGTAITAAALAAGAERGCTSAALRSGPMALSLYQKMGFRPAGVHRTYAVPG